MEPSVAINHVNVLKQEPDLSIPATTGNRVLRHNPDRTEPGQTQPGQDITRTDTTRTGHNPDTDITRTQT